MILIRLSADAAPFDPSFLMSSEEKTPAAAAVEGGDETELALMPDELLLDDGEEFVYAMAPEKEEVDSEVVRRPKRARKLLKFMRVKLNSMLGRAPPPPPPPKPNGQAAESAHPELSWLESTERRGLKFASIVLLIAISWVVFLLGLKMMVSSESERGSCTHCPCNETVDR